jgi:hypothetical protein
VARPRATSDAGRIAATRRKGRGPAVDRDERAPARASGKKGRGKGHAAPSAAARTFRLLVLMATMAALGFVVVLVLDLSMKVVGTMKFGQVTFAELLDKVESRVFDHDVPEPSKKATAKRVQPSSAPSSAASPGSSPSMTSSSSSASSPRAPIAAPAPDVWKRDAVTRPDPEVEQARARLDELLKRI